MPESERILVCVGASPSSSRIVSGACRMAGGLGAGWVAAYVDAPDAYPMSREDRDRLQSHLRLAESLGGDVVRLVGRRVSEEILRYAREHGVTRIVIGKPTHSPVRDILGGSLVNQLVRGSGGIEVHFIAGEDVAPPPGSHRRPSGRVDWSGFALAAVLVTAATGLAWLLRTYLSQTDVVMVYLLTIMIVAFRSGWGPSATAAALAVAAYDFFFVPPYLTFSVEQSRHLLTFAMMFAVGLAISSLASRLRRQGRDARSREERTAALYSLTRELAAQVDLDGAAHAVARHSAEVFGGEATVLGRDGNGAVVVEGRSRPSADLTVEEMAMARRALECGLPAGTGTETMSDAGVLCVPIPAESSATDVLALRFTSRDKLDMEGRRFLDAFLRQAAVSFGRARLAEEARRASLKAREEEMRSTLLTSVSHDLRTPLAAITGAGTALRDDDGRLGPAQKTEMVEAVCIEAERMERLVSNILDMVRLEAGGIVPRREWVPLEEIVGSALVRLEARIGSRETRLDLPRELTMVHVDPVLLEQVVVNLVENALKYAPTPSPVEIGARVGAGSWVMEVADRGPGLPRGEEDRVFEKFYRGPGMRGGGVGLGLAICRGIVEAHGGSIRASVRDGGGTVFRMELPLPAELPSVEPLAHQGSISPEMEQ